MRVYRIEHWQSGTGPYGRPDGVRQYDDHKHPRTAFTAYCPPGPLSDSVGIGTERGTELQSFTGRHLFGFRSVSQLRRWFRSKMGRKAMAALGFVVNVRLLVLTWLQRKGSMEPLAG